jgi:hypothetical protein
MQMNDRVKTRVRPQNISSYAPEKGVNYQQSISWPIIQMTIGSAILVLDYDREEDRDLDIKKLDEVIDKD